MIGEGVWAKRDYVIAGGPPFLLNKKAGAFQDEIVFETMAEYPSLEAAVMRAELEGDMHTPWDSFYLSTLRNGVRILGGG